MRKVSTICSFDKKENFRKNSTMLIFPSYSKLKMPYMRKSYRYLRLLLLVVQHVFACCRLCPNIFNLRERFAIV